MIIQTVFAIIISYLIGSIPTAYIFGKILKKIDIREHGSGNVGATNVFRVLGKTPGFVVLLLDILKGVLPVVIVANMLGLHDVLQYIVLSLSVVSGHNWPIFLNFKGGKGIATTLGILIGLTMQIAAIQKVLLFTLLLWVISFLISRIVSLSSMIAASGLPLIMMLTKQSIEILCLGIIFCIFIIFRHRPNISRLLSGNEPRVPLPFLDRK